MKLSWFVDKSHWVLFPNFLHFSIVWMYLGLSASFKTFSPLASLTLSLPWFLGLPCKLGCASFTHCFCLQPHKAVLASWMWRQQHALMDVGVGRGSCALVEGRLGGLTDSMYTGKHSGVGPSKARPASCRWTEGVPAQNHWMQELVSFFVFSP